jgi:hypothetical protein
MVQVVLPAHRAEPNDGLFRNVSIGSDSETGLHNWQQCSSVRQASAPWRSVP